MELPKYAVSQSLLSSRSVVSSRGDYLRGPLNEFDGSDRHSKAIGKRKRTSPGSASLESGSRSVGLPQYAVPQSFLSPQIVYPSPGDQTFPTPPSNAINDQDRHEHPATISQPGPSIPVHSRQESEEQNHSHPTLSNTQQAEEQLRAARTSSYHFLNEIPNLAFQTTEKDVGGKHNSFMDVSFFPSPTITDPWGEIPTPNLSWDSATKPSFSVNKAMSTADTDVSVLEAAPERGEPESDRSVSTGGPQLDPSASIDARLSQVLKAVDAAGFDSLDSAVIAYYKKSSKGNDGLRQEQRLNRMRRLPVLLKELHHSAQGWGQWERRNFQEQIIRSTEDILFAELEDHLASRRTSPQNSPYGNEQRGASHQSEEDQTDVEAELPNTWTLLTSLSTKYSIIASQDWEGDMPKLVGKFLAAGTELGS